MKYQGNKNRIVQDILPILLKDRKQNQWYVEPFCGSCSVLQHVSGNRMANDKNKSLIAMWKSLVSGKDMPTRIEKDYYADVRDCFNGKNNRYSDDIIGLVGYMASFNGRFFDAGYSGHSVATKTGKPRDYITENIKNTVEQVPMLSDVTWSSTDYFDMHIPENSLIYADPPYKNTKQYQFSRDFDHVKFYQWYREVVQKGNTLFVSEYEMPEDFQCIWPKQITTTMNQTITKKPFEKLFVLKQNC